MSNLPKCRVLWIMGILLICIGALVHSHASSWATVPYPPSVDPTGKAMYVDTSQNQLYEDIGIAMMALGGIAFTFGLISWVYPPGPRLSSEANRGDDVRAH